MMVDALGAGGRDVRVKVKVSDVYPVRRTSLRLLDDILSLLDCIIGFQELLSVDLSAELGDLRGLVLDAFDWVVDSPAGDPVEVVSVPLSDCREKLSPVVLGLHEVDDVGVALDAALFGALINYLIAFDALSRSVSQLEALELVLGNSGSSQ